MSFVLGFICGVLTVVIWGMHKAKQYIKQEEEFGKRLLEEAERFKNKINNAKDKIVSVRDRLAEVHDISKRMHELQAEAEQPSKNATHSKYKNGIIAEMRALEDKKNSILTSILNDGFDPVITVLNEDGSKEDMKLSQFVARSSGSEPLKEGELPPPPPAEKDEIDEELDKVQGPKKVGKFFVYSGGKPDTSH